MKMALLRVLCSAVLVLLSAASSAVAKDPDCARTTGWAANMAFGQLKNAGITNNEQVDFAKTRVVRMASERIGKDLYRQVHHITFIEKTGKTIDVITVNDASSEECSMSDVDVYVIGKHLKP